MKSSVSPHWIKKNNNQLIRRKKLSFKSLIFVAHVFFSNEHDTSHFIQKL